MSRVGSKALQGSLWITLGSLAYNAISLVGGIIIARLLSPDEYGVLNIALTWPLFFAGLAKLALNTAITRYAAAGMRGRALYGVYLTALNGLFSGVFVFLAAEFLASTLGRPYLSTGIEILSIFVVAEVVQTSATSYFVGIGHYGKYIASDLVRTSSRVLLTVVLVMLGLGVYGAYWGLSGGYLLAALLSMYLLYKTVRGRVKAEPAARELLGYSLPLFLPSLATAPLSQIYNVFLANYATNAEMGNLKVAQNLLTPISLISGAMSTALFSSLPELLGEEYKLRQAVRRAALIIALAVSPIALALALFSGYVVDLIYGEAYVLAPLYLSILALGSLTAPFGVVALYLNIIGDTKFAGFLTFTTTALAVPIALALLVKMGFLGAVIASPINAVMGAAVTYIAVRKRHGLTLDVLSILRYMLPAGISVLATVPLMMLTTGLVRLLFGLIVYVTSLGISSLVLVKRNDLEYLYTLLRSVKTLAPLAIAMHEIVVKVRSIFGS